MVPPVKDRRDFSFLNSLSMVASTPEIYQTYSSHRITRAIIAVALCLILGGVVLLQSNLDRWLDTSAKQIEDLAQLPKGEYLKPALLGYHHIASDVLWLRMVQVLGKKRQTADDFEWLYHVLDVITTLDPKYTYAYQVGGIVLTELANRPDLSNRILEKGLDSNPTAWWLPFNMGYNYFFYLGDAAKAAEYTLRAAQLPGRPTYLPGLAARMYAEAGNPDVALNYLEAMWRQTENKQVKESLELRMKELTIERDIRLLENAVAQFRERHHALPKRLTDMTADGVLASVPQEPFGGEYRLNPETGSITSSTHPKRLRVYRPSEAGKID